jgi:2-dehydropantoate 2-reductase
MRYVVVGAGSVGGVVGGRLAQYGADVVLVARGEHGRTIAEQGLAIEAPEGTVRVRVPVAADIGQVVFTKEDVVLLCVKSQDTVLALDELRAATDHDLSIACLQNGVTNEPEALRRFTRVYGVCVMCPSGYLEPGIVQAKASPVAAILDIGRYPDGIDDTCRAVSAAFEAATLVSLPRADIMRWKYSKLLMNLVNAVDALFEPSDRAKHLVELARAEGRAALRAAGIDFASEQEDAERRGNLLQQRPIPGRSRIGSSSWQSLARGARSIETDAFNGEIVLLGRLHGVATPVNAKLQQWASRAALRGDRPGAASLDEFFEGIS